MNTLYIVIYLVAFALLVGGAFGLMYANVVAIRELQKQTPRRHPEAPKPGEEVMYVDVSSDTADEFQARKDKLEDLFNK